MSIGPMILAALTYAGLLLATISAIWGTTHDVKEKDTFGNSRLTPAGRVSIVLTVVGLLISAAATYIDDQLKRDASYRQAMQEQRAEEQKQLDKLTQLQRDAEARQERRDVELQQERRALETRQEQRELVQQQDQREARRQVDAIRAITVSGQKLTAIRVRWTFKNVPEAVAKAVVTELAAAEEFETGNEDLFQELRGSYLTRARQMVHRHKVLYPWLNVLAQNTSTDSSAVVLVSLDSTFSSVLPLGLVRYEKQTQDFAGTVEFPNEFDAWTHFNVFERSRSTAYEAHLERDGLNIAAVWNIEAGSLDQAIDRLEKDVSLAAALPDRIFVTILTSIERLPVAASNAASGFAEIAEQGGFPSNGDFRERSTFDIQPNNLHDYHVTYKMRFRGSRNFEHYDPVYDTRTNYCQITSWEGSRVYN
jgi:hypothetical protein